MSAPTGTALVLDTPEIALLPASKSEQIRNTFVPMADMLQSFETEYGSIMDLAAVEVTPGLSARARRLRLDIAKIRVGAENARKRIKEEYLLAGRAIDGTNNVLKWAISQKEDALEAIEQHVARVEAERVAALQFTRALDLAGLVEDVDSRDLGSMDADVWDAYLATKRKDHADRMDAERKAEEERVARLEVERAEQAAIRAERDRLAKEAAEKEQARLAELAKIEAERAKERKAAEAERAKVEKAAAAERQQREALEAAERDRLAKIKAEENARTFAAAMAARAPVRKRLGAWVDSFALPELPGDDHEAVGAIRERFASFCAWARAEVELP